MSDLIIIGYDDHESARRSYARVIDLQKDQRTEDKFTDALRPFGGEILKTSSSNEQEKELAEDLGAVQAFIAVTARRNGRP